ncbi:MAG: ribonuclease HI [Nitrospiraceae bacterium]|nr:MAG: ribonuclease HI [Nitrospiraceae bacterium]
MGKTSKPFVHIYTDGACSGNPGIGGFCAILKTDRKTREITGSERTTTNNRMELMSVISALEKLRKPCRVIITTDSNYVVKGMTEWITGWTQRNWLNAQNKAVLNRDLWERLITASEQHEIEWHWVKGHNGHPENERCDMLARGEISKLRQKIRDE